MNENSGLKYALVLVLVTSVVLLGWTTYLERKSNNKIEAFAKVIGEVDTDSGAKAVIKNFLLDAGKGSSALSASADGKPCGWLCD